MPCQTVEKKGDVKIVVRASALYSNRSPKKKIKSKLPDENGKKWNFDWFTLDHLLERGFASSARRSALADIVHT